MWGAKMLVGLKREPSPPDDTKSLKILLRTAASWGERTTTLSTATPRQPILRIQLIFIQEQRQGLL